MGFPVVLLVTMPRLKACVEQPVHCRLKVLPLDLDMLCRWIQSDIGTLNLQRRGQILHQPCAVAVNLLDQDDHPVATRHPLLVDGKLRVWCAANDVGECGGELLLSLGRQGSKGALHGAVLVGDLVLLVRVDGLIEGIGPVSGVRLEGGLAGRGVGTSLDEGHRSLEESLTPCREGSGGEQAHGEMWWR